jgi:type I restriction enzyme R subunit
LEKNNTAIQSYANKVIEIASKLETKENIPIVAEQIALIKTSNRRVLERYYLANA